MAGAVEFRVVDGDQGTVRAGQRPGRLRDQRAQAVRGTVGGPAHGRQREAGLLQPARGHPVGVDAGGRRPLVDRRGGLPAQRVDLLVPAQPVEQPVLARHGDLVAEHPVPSRRQAGAQGAEAGHRGGREPGGQGAPGGGELGQERGRRLMGAQQLPAQPVHDEQAGPAGGGQPERVRRVAHAQRGEQRGGQVGQGSLAVIGHSGRGRRLSGHAAARQWPGWVVASVSATAKASTCRTASSPSAASLTRMVRSSAVMVPV